VPKADIQAVTNFECPVVGFEKKHSPKVATTSTIKRLVGGSTLKPGALRCRALRLRAVFALGCETHRQRGVVVFVLLILVNDSERGKQ
jgi:hypothetical protein